MINTELEILESWPDYNKGSSVPSMTFIAWDGAPPDGEPAVVNATQISFTAVITAAVHLAMNAPVPALIRNSRAILRTRRRISLFGASHTRFGRASWRIAASSNPTYANF
jgi:hypothetical protein